MPVPVWDCSDMSLLDEPLDTVLSDDIWKKFDLDEPLDSPYVHGHQTGGSGIGQTANTMYSHASNSIISDKTITAMTMMMSNNNNNNSNNLYDESGTSQAVTLTEFYDKITCHESREIRHHDCMWAGLCISKEHNRTLPAKKDSLVQSKKIPAGRSLLISSRATSATHHQQIQQQQQQMQQQNLYQQRRKDSLESDGDSTRPETPQSSESESESENDEDEDDDDEEEEEEDHNEIEASRDLSRRQILPQQIRIKQEDGPLIFKHDQISINEKLSECMTDDISMTTRAAPVSEVTGQFVRKYHHQQQQQQQQQQHHQTIPETRIKIENEYCQKYENNEILQRNIVVKTEPDNWNTLSDHCYHQPSSKNLEHLGVQTPSDSEEEIDVVTFEKPCRPAALPTYPSIADQQHFQLTVNSALKEKPVPAPRPRGRPPSNGGGQRKRSGTQSEQKPAKRARHRTYQRRSKVTKNVPPTPVASPLKAPPTTPTAGTSTSRSGSSDDEPDTEKRSMHNNMERQRRIELRNAFEDLRVLVPEVEAKEKAPKVAILRQAAVYCDMLTEIGQVTASRVTEMKRRQERLRARLSQLRRSLAMTR